MRTLYDGGVAALGSGTSFRRAHIGVQGIFYQEWGLKREVGFPNEEVPLADVLLPYLGFDPIIITAGHYKPLFWLDNMSSANDITFTKLTLTESGIEPI